MREADPQRRPKRPPSPGRIAGTIAAALALAVVVVIARRGERASGSVDTGGQTTSRSSSTRPCSCSRSPRPSWSRSCCSPSSRAGRAEPQPRTGPKLLGQLLAFALFCGFVLALVAFVARRPERGRPRSAADGVAAALQSLQAKASADNRDSVDWLPAGIVFAGTLAALAATGVVIMRRQPLAEPEAALAERLARIFDETLEDLRAEQDPRRAVIAAYGRMERILGNYGMERRPAEAPHEYVSRVLEQVVASGSVGAPADAPLRARAVQRARDRPDDEGAGDRRGRGRARRAPRDRGRSARGGASVKFSARAAAVAIAIVSLAIVLTAVPEQRALSIQIYAFGLCGLVLLWLLGRTGAWRVKDSAFDDACTPRPAAAEPLPELARVEREVTLGVATAFDLHFRLRPPDPRDRRQPARRPARHRPRAAAGRGARGARRRRLGARPPRPRAATRASRAGARPDRLARGAGGP